MLELATVLFFGSLLVLLFAGVPLLFVLGGVSVVVLTLTTGTAGLYIVASKVWESINNQALIAIPMYIFMAILLEKSGVADRLYRMMHLWFGGIRGGLAIGTVAICVIFAAMSGISGAAVVTMGTIALPQMLKRGYDKRLAVGAINCGGGWGILIPPSIVMIVFALLTDVSVGRLFAAGVMPGLILFVLVCIYILVRTWLNPRLGPALAKEERGSWGEKYRALRAVILPIGIVVMVLGAIFSGAATATEAAGLGVLGAFIAMGINRSFSIGAIKEAVTRTTEITVMVLWILFAAHAFSTAYITLGAEDLINNLMLMIPGGQYGALIFMLFILFILGMVLDPIGIMLITLPSFMPLVEHYGWDKIWYGVLFIIMMEISYMTPPFGFNLFYMKAIAPPEVSMRDIYTSVIPYVLVTLVGVAIMVVWPQAILWLPDKLFGPGF